MRVPSKNSRVPKAIASHPVNAEVQTSEGSANGDVRGGGQKPYVPNRATIAKVICAFGGTNAALAEAFNVTIGTIREWQAADKEFSDSCAAGAKVCRERIEVSLHERAAGYYCRAEKVVVIKGRATVVQYRRHVPADVAAAKFLLTTGSDIPGIDAATYEKVSSQAIGILLKEINGTHIKPIEYPPEPAIESD